MTITYTGHVANARLSAFSRLLFYWKGSIYKLMYKEMIIFCILYGILSVVYRNALDNDQRRWFEKVALYCETFANLIPLSFVLGFYVSLVVTRWWNQYMCIPWPDRVMLYVSTMIDGVDETARLTRRTLMRYLTLGSLIVFQATSVRIKKRFPTMDHLIEAGIVTRSEVKMLEEVNTPHGKWWIPFVWCCNMVRDARRQGRIADSYLMKTIIDEIMTYRGNLGMLYSFDWISVPLVYTQVTTLAAYTFFIGCLFGRQFLDPSQNYEGHDIDLYIPFFTLLQFFFYMGWLKVAEQLINPFGEDDDDFEMNWIVDRNMQVSLLTTDDLYGQVPPLEKDLYYGEPPPDYLPYTKSSVKGMSQPHMGSTADLRISDEGMKVLSPLETIQEGVALGHPAQVPVQPIHGQAAAAAGSSLVPGASSHLNTPFHRATSGATPIASPRYMRHLSVNNGGNVGSVVHSQNLMSYGVRSPVDVMSRTSRDSVGLTHDDVTDPDVVSQIQVPSSLPVNFGSSVMGRVTEKLGRWLTHHGSSSDLAPIGSVNYSSNMHGLVVKEGLHGTRSGTVDDALEDVLYSPCTSRQISAEPPANDTSTCLLVGAMTSPSTAPLSANYVVLATSTVPGSSAGVVHDVPSSTVVSRPRHLPPLAALFNPQPALINIASGENSTAISAIATPSSNDPDFSLPCHAGQVIGGGGGNSDIAAAATSNAANAASKSPHRRTTSNSRTAAGDNVVGHRHPHVSHPGPSAIGDSRAFSVQPVTNAELLVDHATVLEQRGVAKLLGRPDVKVASSTVPTNQTAVQDSVSVSENTGGGDLFRKLDEVAATLFAHDMQPGFAANASVGDVVATSRLDATDDQPRATPVALSPATATDGGCNRPAVPDTQEGFCGRAGDDYDGGGSTLERSSWWERSQLNVDGSGTELYERPESNQCTVTSLTPLLQMSNGDELDEFQRTIRPLSSVEPSQQRKAASKL